jgi:hypothetical protein
VPESEGIVRSAPYVPIKCYLVANQQQAFDDLAHVNTWFREFGESRVNDCAARACAQRA